MTRMAALEFDCTAPPRAWLKADQRLAALSERIAQATHEDGLLGFSLRYHFAKPGQQLRARLALSASAALRVPAASALELAAACELLHNASLVHDDLQDRDETRRGQPAIWSLFGEDQAVNVGDYLLTRALDVVSHLDAHATWNSESRGSP